MVLAGRAVGYCVYSTHVSVSVSLPLDGVFIRENFR
jgi:hypothetical protein